VRARVHTLEATPDQLEAGLKLVTDDLLPWARDSTGYCGAVGLIDAEGGRALLITLWTDDETRAESAEAAERFSSLTADASGARRAGMENYDVGFVDIVGGLPPTPGG
jgi:hypothetical protein